MTRFKGSDKVKNWGQAIAKRSCHREARVAVVRKLAMIMHVMWERRNVLCRRSGGNPGGCRPECPWQGAQASGSASMSGSSAVQTHGAGTSAGAT